MGTICTKLLPANRRSTSKVIFKNKVTPVLPSDDLKDENQRSEKGNDEYFMISKQEHDFETHDILSRGDHIREEQSNINKNTDQIEHDLSHGDCQQENSEITRIEQNIILQNEFSEKEEKGDPVPDVISSPTAQVEQNTSIQDSLSNEDHEGIKNSNANSKTEVEQHHVPWDILPDGVSKRETTPDGNRHIIEHDTLSDKTPNKDQDTQTNNVSISTQVGSEIELKCVDTVLRDSLYFFPLACDGQSTPAPLRLQERLQNAASRKPTLTYDERMLLADLNRFEQLDKRREFAVRQNRSIIRNMKLPKITDILEVSPENSSNSLNCPDD